MSTPGVILMVVGASLMVTEAHVPTHGVLGTGAAAALTAGVVLALSGAGAAGGAVVAAGVTVALAGLALALLLLVKSLPAWRFAAGRGSLLAGWRRCALCRRRSVRCNSTARSGAPACGNSVFSPHEPRSGVGRAAPARGHACSAATKS
jgi:hypothetical protein